MSEGILDSCFAFSWRMTANRQLFRAICPFVVSEATAEEKLVASLESVAVAFDTT
jgi:hypothetical protein